MQDKEIKELLRKDHSQPSAPKNEWSAIEKQLDSETQSEKWFWSSGPTLVAALTILILVLLPLNQRSKSNQVYDSDELERYLLEDFFPHEEEQGVMNQFDAL